MRFLEADFSLSKGKTSESEDLRRRLDALCRDVRSRASDDPILSDVVHDYYVGSRGDPRDQWFCFLPGDKEFKTAFIHFHGVLPQGGLHGFTPWFGLNVEFTGPRETLASKLMTGSDRQAFLAAAQQAGDVSVWIIDKLVMRTDHQRYEWGAVDPGRKFPISRVDDAFLRGLRETLRAPPVPSWDRPGWETWPAVVVGWFVEPDVLISWGDEASGELLELLRRMAALWALLARGY